MCPPPIHLIIIEFLVSWVLDIDNCSFLDWYKDFIYSLLGSSWPSGRTLASWEALFARVASPLYARVEIMVKALIVFALIVFAQGDVKDV